MEREVQHKVDSEMKTEIQYYHRIVVVVLVSTAFTPDLPCRSVFRRTWPAEDACALASPNLVGQLGRRFLDVLVGDALYLQAPFVQEVERLGLAWAFTLKENQPELLHEAERCTQDSPHGVQAEPGREIQYWHLPDLDWPVADRQVRVVKIVRIASQRRVMVPPKKMTPSSAKTWVRKYRNKSSDFTPPISNSARSRRCSSSSSAAAVGESIPKSFRPSPPTATSNTQRSTKLRPWWC